MTGLRTRDADHRRGSIQLPGGRSITGIRPGLAGNRGRPSMDLLRARRHGCPATETVEEHQLRDDLARQLGGVTEADVPLGFADMATRKAVFEVEPRHSWQDGARQVLAYSAQCGLPPALALFRAIPAAEMLTVLTELRAMDLPGLHADFIDLLWWTGQAWQQITSPELCADMPHGAVFGPCGHCGRRVVWFDRSVLCFDYDPANRINQIHCCAGLCPVAHEKVKWCLYWAERRAFPSR